MAAALGAGGCSASQPVLYPNEQMQRAGRGAADEAVRTCTRLADDYLKSGGAEAEAARQAAGRTATGAATGGATGAVAGAIYGDAGRGAAAGAASGATAGLVSSLFGSFGSRQPSPTYRAFVERCLRERGYEPIGWE